MTGKQVGFGFFFFLTLVPLSCTLNPLNGLLENINVQILTVAGLNGAKPANAGIRAANNSLSVPTTIPTQASDFDCIAFNVTGYGIEEKEDVAGSQIPIASLRLGLETPMQRPASNPSLNFNVKVPTLLGVDPTLQKRQIQILGVYTSLTDKASCEGKNLYDFLLEDDPNAAVYLIGSDYYPSTAAACTNGSLCIRDDIVFNGTPGVELIYYYLAPENLYPEFVFVNGDQLFSGIPLFNDSDVYSGRGNMYNGNSSLYLSKPSLTGRMPRIDFYFAISKYKMNRSSTGYIDLDFGAIQAKNYPVASSLCGATATPSSYSGLQIKIWNGTTASWVNPPRNGSTTDLTLAAANVLSYSINFFELTDDTVQTELIDGTEYLIVSLRSNEPACSSIRLSRAPIIKFY